MLALLAMIVEGATQLLKLVVTTFEDAMHPVYSLSKSLVGFRCRPYVRAVVKNDRSGRVVAHRKRREM